MKLLDPYSGLMECTRCGERHRASVRPQSGGQYYRGSWQCRHGCQPLDALERLRQEFEISEVGGRGR
jgi:hypothetical protein